MASSINRVVISGNLTKDPELRSLPSGTQVCSMRIANNTRRKQDGEWQDYANYFDVTVWGTQGENCAKWLEKGRGIMVDGRLEWREWKDKEGNNRQAVQIVGENVQFMPGKDGGGGGQSQPVSDVPADTGGLGIPSGGGDDDIPF